MAKPPHNGGRPPKLTRELITDICNAIRIGSYVETAAMYCGVQKETLYLWFRKGRAQTRGLYAELIHAINQAAAEAEHQDVGTLKAAAQGLVAKYMVDKKTGLPILDGKGKPILERPGLQPDWRAAAWRLERRAPKKWGPRHQIELTDPATSDSRSDEQLDAKVEKLKKRLGLT